MCLSLPVIIAVIYTPLRLFYGLAYWLYLFSIVLLLAVFAFGKTISGSERWISLGFINLQPSEFAKVATILAVSRYLSEKEVFNHPVRATIVSIGLVSVPAVMINQQPDLGTSLIFIALVLPMLFWARIPLFIIFILVAPFISILSAINGLLMAGWVLILIGILYLARQGILITISSFLFNIVLAILGPYFWNHLKPYQQMRILTFLNPEIDPKGGAYQILQSKTALGSGGLNGKGFLQGTQTQLKFLPETHTDFIYTVVGEEFGFLGAGSVMLLFGAIIFRALFIAYRTKSQFPSLILVGTSIVLFTHVFINMGMTMGIMPVTGVPLPFLSYGGSFFIAAAVLIGLILNVSRHKIFWGIE